MKRTGSFLAWSAIWPAVLLNLALAAGCGGTSGEKMDPEPVPVYNPDPNNPLKDVTLENEAKNLDRIRNANKPPSK